MDFTQYVLLAAVVAGVTELITRLRAKDYWTAVTITCAAVIGLVFGIFGVEGLDVVTGIAAGFGASGALTAVGMLGNKSNATPTPPVKR